MKLYSPKLLLILLLLVLVDYIIGMIRIDLMEIDTMQYASIAREMLESGEFLQIHHRHLEYLDKPPLLFWLSSLSFSILGPSPFSFRLPSLLFTILGAFSTYKLGKIYYNKETGLLAAIILTSSQAWFLINHDPRTDSILAGAVIFGVWQVVEYLRYQKALNFFLGFLGISLAMLEKGPIGIMVPVLAIGSELIYKRDWKNLFKWQWIGAAALILILLSPMLWGLFQQYGWKGIKFYFWTQSFGRITGESVWEDSTGYFYFVHTFLWAFMPWMILSIYGIVMRISDIFKTKKSENIEILTLGGFLLPFIALSFSHFKLPHYIFVGFPFIAILTADSIQKVLSKKEFGTARFFYFIQFFINLILWASIAFLSIKVFPLTNAVIWIVSIVLLILSLYFTTTRKRLRFDILIPSALTIIGVNLLLNIHFYPQLLSYQSGTSVAKYIQENQIPVNNVYAYENSSHSLDFYLNTIVPIVKNKSEISRQLDNQDFIWLVANKKNKEHIDSFYLNAQTVKEFNSFRISLLNSQFLNPATRSSVLSKIYLIKISSSE